MKTSQKKITIEETEHKETKQNVSKENVTSKKRKRNEAVNGHIKNKKESKKQKCDIDATVEVENVKSLKNIGDEDDEQTPVLEADKYPLKNFRLSQKTIKRLNARGITSLFEIQALTFDRIFEGKDLIGRARTGMGKTLAFVLPLIEKLMMETKADKSIRVLVLAPVRELAKQISEEFESVTDLNVACFYGGIPVTEHIQKLKSGFDILVATPGRVNDLLERGVLNLNKVQYVVLDEADKMLEMGFKEEIEKILAAVGFNENEEKGKHPQTLLFSATVPDWVKRISTTYMAHDKVIVDMVESEDQKASTDVRHIAVPCQQATLRAIIVDLISMYAGPFGRTLIFCNTKADCNNFVSSEDFTMDCSVINGDIPQQQREVMLQAFRDGKVKVLIATDVAARGLDMVVDLVIQTQPPIRKSGHIDIDTYVHRSGRTGRAGKKGVCITLYNSFQKNSLKKIEAAIGNKFEWLSAPKQDDVVGIAAVNVLEQVKNVDKDVLPYYEEATKQFLSQYKSNEAVSYLLALVTGYLKPPRQRSMLSSQFDFVTFQYLCQKEIPSHRYVYVIMKKHLKEHIVESIKRFTLSQDHYSAVFDVPIKYFADFEALARENAHFKVCDQLPTLEDKYEFARNRGYDNKNGRNGENNRGSSYRRNGGINGNSENYRGNGNYRNHRNFSFGKSQDDSWGNYKNPRNFSFGKNQDDSNGFNGKNRDDNGFGRNNSSNRSTFPNNYLKNNGQNYSNKKIKF